MYQVIHCNTVTIIKNWKQLKLLPIENWLNKLSKGKPHKLKSNTKLFTVETVKISIVK